ncbi:glycosyltransferase [Alicyclobacillus curvatus]|nr:glycosyltransferase [Alicyclobacillus curvatus]
MQVVLQDYFYTSTGFGNAAREIAFAMEDLGVNVKVDVLGPKVAGWLSRGTIERLARLESKRAEHDKVLVCLEPHPERGAAYRKRINYKMFETNVAPQPYVATANGFDALIVPNEFNRQAFRRGGTKVPVYVANYGVNSQVFTPNGPKHRWNEPDDVFVFLSVFGWSQKKGPDVLVRAFLEEFSADERVVLVIKTFSAGIHDFPWEWYDDIAKTVQKENKPSVRIVVDEFSPEQMATIYRGANCFVLPSRGEGVCLPILESMACQVPVIATGWGGFIDFFGPKSGYHIPYTMVKTSPQWFSSLYGPEQMWADPDVHALQTLMRRVFTLRDEASAKAQHGLQVAQQWSWHRTAEQFISAIEATVGSSIR